MTKINKEKECDGDCPLCDPESYVVEVDAFFMRKVLGMYESLNRIKKDYYTTPWLGEEIDKKMKQIHKKRN